jgi:hypothetical protein
MKLTDDKIWLYGLFVACPEGTPLPDCPVEKYRSLPDKKKITILENLSEKEVENIIKHHHKCLLRRV